MKPMLAAAIEDVKDLTFPLYASPKLDGVRCIVKDGVVLSRSLKPIPNLHVQKTFGHLQGIDGELIVGPANASDVYRKTVSGVMSIEGAPDVTLYAFDYLGANCDEHTTPFEERNTLLTKVCLALTGLPVKHLQQTKLRDLKQLENYEKSATDNSYEGVIVRSPMGQYKYGRSTLKQGWLLKLKRFLDAEAEIIGFEELLHNANEATTNELGRTARSSHQENLVKGSTLGALKVKDCTSGVCFSIGTGFSAEQRQQYWDNQDSLLGKLVVYKYFPVGVKDAPRHPVFKGFRSELDL